MHAALSGTWPHETGWCHAMESILQRRADRNDKYPTISAIYFLTSAMRFCNNQCHGSATCPPAVAPPGGSSRGGTTGTVGGTPPRGKGHVGAIERGRPVVQKAARPGLQHPADRQVLRVVVLASPPAEALDIVGPIAVFDAVNRLRTSRQLAPRYQIELLSTARKRLIAGDSGLALLAHGHYRALRGHVDTLLISGGSGVMQGHSAAVLAWLRQCAGRVRRLCSICTGAFLLAEAGLLQGRQATTHWLWAPQLAAQYPAVTVKPHPIWIQDGYIYTSAGVTAGMDLALALVEEDCGNAMALEVARVLVMFLRRPGGQAQFSVSLSTQTSARKSLHELQSWIAENLAQDLSVAALASHVAMSPRHFARVFTQELGITPARYVEHARLEAARRQLELTEKSQEEIAAGCGFGSAELLRRAFLRRLDSTPGRYRRLFHAATRIDHQSRVRVDRRRSVQ
jgi:transcriptional regulator GlxA family with amidase domain